MRTSSLIFMVVTWGVILGFFLYSLVKTLREGNPKPETRNQIQTRNGKPER